MQPTQEMCPLLKSTECTTNNEIGHHLAQWYFPVEQGKDWQRLEEHDLKCSLMTTFRSTVLQKRDISLSVDSSVTTVFVSMTTHYRCQRSR